MIRYFLLLAILLGAFSCRKDDAAPKEYEVVAQGVGGDCRLPLVDFVDSQQREEIRKLFGSSLTAYSESGRYNALNLPTTLPKGTKVYITIRQLTRNELPMCTAMGPAYNTVFALTYRVE